MPLVRISLMRGKPAGFGEDVGRIVYEAMVETIGVPQGDRFQLITEHDADDFSYGADYLGIRRSDDLVIVQLTVSNTRTPAQKQALFGRIAERLTRDPGLRPEDVFVNLVEVKPENWSFGHGLAQYAAQAA